VPRHDLISTGTCRRTVGRCARGSGEGDRSYFTCP